MQRQFRFDCQIKLTSSALWRNLFAGSFPKTKHRGRVLGMNFFSTVRLLCLTLVLGVSGVSLDAFAAPHAPLQIYFIDVEGGQATLFVTPSRHSLLIDTGWPEHGGRDADRIAAAAKAAGINRIDYVLLTHYHVDHTGGVPQLVAKIPVGTFIDHGPNRETDNPSTAQAYAAYQKVLADGHYGHIVAKPGDSYLRVSPTTGTFESHAPPSCLSCSTTRPLWVSETVTSAFELTPALTCAIESSGCVSAPSTTDSEYSGAFERSSAIAGTAKLAPTPSAASSTRWACANWRS